VLEQVHLKHILVLIFSWLVTRILVSFIFNFSESYTSGDSVYYFEVARNILASGTHIDDSGNLFIRAPLYSFFVASVLFIKDSPLLFFVIQSLLFLIIPVSVYLFLKKFNTNAALLCSFLVCISPFDALYNGRVLSETLVTVFLCTGSIMFLSKRWLLSGVLLGAAALTRNIYLLLPFLFLFIALFTRTNKKSLLVFLMGFLLVISPWVIRNSLEKEGGFFVSDGEIFWLNLFAGTYMTSYKDDIMPIYNPSYVPRVIFEKHNLDVTEEEFKEKFLNAKENQEFFREKTLEYVKENPVDLIFTWIKRTPHMWLGTRTDLVNWTIERETSLWYSIKTFFYLMNLMFLSFSLLGFYACLQSHRYSLFLITPIIYNALIYIPFYNVETRFSQPIYPLLLIFSGFGMIYIYQKYKERKTT
jgi:hypothetical protein